MWRRSGCSAPGRALAVASGFGLFLWQLPINLLACLQGHHPGFPLCGQPRRGGPAAAPRQVSVRGAAPAAGLGAAPEWPAGGGRQQPTHLLPLCDLCSPAGPSRCMPSACAACCSCGAAPPLTLTARCCTLPTTATSLPACTSAPALPCPAMPDVFGLVNCLARLLYAVVTTWRTATDSSLSPPALPLSWLPLQPPMRPPLHVAPGCSAFASFKTISLARAIEGNVKKRREGRALNIDPGMM